MRLGPTLLIAAAIVFILFFALVPQWRLPGHGTQIGWRGSSMVQFDPTQAQAAAFGRQAPSLPAISDDSRPATAAFKNVKVLNDLNAGDFMRLQVAMTEQVSPKQGCGYCHVGTDYASDAKPAKAAARLMLAMTRHINGAWGAHVGAGGVTCYSCHQGEPAPADIWFQSPAHRSPPMIDRQEDWHESARTVRRFFPNEGFEEYLLQDTPGLVQSYTALPKSGPASQIETKRVYEVMMQMSDGLGVNCGYCHNSRAFFDWSQSSPNRWTGYSGIKMTQDINRNYLLNLAKALPLSRIVPTDTRTLSIPSRDQGPQIGNGLADCATCHHGAPRPLGGAGPGRGLAAFWKPTTPAMPAHAPA